MRRYFGFAVPGAAEAVGVSVPGIAFEALLLSLSSNFSASSVVIFPAASISSTFFLSSDMTTVSFQTVQMRLVSLTSPRLLRRSVLRGTVAPRRRDSAKGFQSFYRGLRRLR